VKTPTEPELLQRAAEAAGFGTDLSRRKFLVLSACAVTGLAALNLSGAWGADPPLIIIDNARGLIVSDPTRCGGCLRCELACTEFNDGRAQPSLARIKVSRNIHFGPEGPSGGSRMQGAWGNGLVIQDTCRQCPHPVPCANACPANAIKADPATGARIVDAAACVGCRLCLRACPYDMITFDEQTQKAGKCFLCQGSPKCVEACPAAALSYIPWRDLTRGAAPRTAVLTVVSGEKAASCMDCHTQGVGK
jgi:Fe-S-cluster-containing dehydrogenase component